MRRTHSGKFVLCNRDLGCAVLMFPIYFIVNLRNLGRAICKLSSQEEDETDEDGILREILEARFKKTIAVSSW